MSCGCDNIKVNTPRGTCDNPPCTEQFDAKCVLYTEEIKSLGIKANTPLSDVIEAIADIIATKVITNRISVNNINYIATNDDYYIVYTNLTVPRTILLPSNPTNGKTFLIKDGVGSAAMNNITINANGKTIDGSATLVINTNYGVKKIIYNSSTNNYETIV